MLKPGKEVTVWCGDEGDYGLDTAAFQWTSDVTFCRDGDTATVIDKDGNVATRAVGRSFGGLSMTADASTGVIAITNASSGAFDLSGASLSAGGQVCTWLSAVFTRCCVFRLA